MRPGTFLFVDQSSSIFSSNVEGGVVDRVFFSDFRYVEQVKSNLVIKFLQLQHTFLEGPAECQLQYTYRSAPEIFAIKVESCQNSCRNLDVFFALPKFRGQAFQKLYGTNSPLEKFREDTPTKILARCQGKAILVTCSPFWWTDLVVAVLVLTLLVCGRFGFSVWPFWSHVWPFRLWTFWFVAVLDVIQRLYGITLTMDNHISWLLTTTSN